MAQQAFLKQAQDELAEAEKFFQQGVQQQPGQSGTPQTGTENYTAQLQPGQPQAGQQSQEPVQPGQAPLPGAQPPEDLNQQQPIQGIQPQNLPNQPARDLTQQPGTPPPVNTEQDKNWQSLYHVLRGKYDKEVPRLQEDLRQRDFLLEQQGSQIRDLQSQITQFRTEISQSQHQTGLPGGQQPQGSQLPGSGQASKQVNFDFDQLKEQYGDEFATMARLLEEQREANAQQQKTITDLMNALQTVNTNVQGVAQQVGKTQQQRFEEELSRLCPEWAQIENDPAFADWLNQSDELSGFPRRQLAVPHWQARDAGKVARFYNAFKSQFYGQSPMQPNNPATPDFQQQPQVQYPQGQFPQQPQQQGQPGQYPQQGQQPQSPQIPQNQQAPQYPNNARPYQAPPLESQVEPNRGPVVQDVQMPGQKSMWTIEEADLFYESSAKGAPVNPKDRDAYGRPRPVRDQQTLAAIERDISLAAQEGRMTGTPTVGKFGPSDMRFLSP